MAEASRIRPQTVSDTGCVTISARWKGNPIPEEAGGEFVAQIAAQGGTTTFTWLFSFNPLAGSGTSGLLELEAEELSYLPTQPVMFHNGASPTWGWIDEGVLSATLVIAQDIQIAVHGQLAARTLN